MSACTPEASAFSYAHVSMSWQAYACLNYEAALAATIGDCLSLTAFSKHKANGTSCSFVVRALSLMQKLTHKELQREATQRLNEFMGQIRNQTSVDVSAKNLGEEGCAYVVEALAFNDR